MSKPLRILAAILLTACAGSPLAEPATSGEQLYQAHCSSCHANPETRSPDLQSMQRMPLSRILSAMEFGKMQLQAAHLPAEQRLALAQWLARADDSTRDDWIASHACEHRSTAPAVTGNANWGFGNDNARHVASGVALNPRTIEQLELAWSLALPQVSDMRSQPVVAGEMLYLGTQTGSLLALDRRSGCVHWQFRAMSTIRSALTLDRAPDGAPTLFFADDLGTVYAVAAKDGRLRWSANVRLFQTSVISGAISSHDGRLFVPLSSFEVAVAGMPTHECCRSHGGVVALDAGNGTRLWEFHTTPDARKTLRNSAGTQMWGPSGASVWSTPTVDANRGLLYIGTGENLSRPATDTSDAVIAIDIETGARRWHFQALADDVWNGACQLGGPNCPDNPGPDWDIGASVILTRTVSGSELLLVGQKSGEVFALDPGHEGRLLWRKRLSQGTANGGNSGVHWGMASDGAAVFVPISDPDWKLPGYTPRPGVYALRVEDGTTLWEHPVQRGCEVDPADVPRPGLAEMRQAGNAARSPWPACSWFYAHSAAALLANGLVYAGALDGRVRVIDAGNGKLLKVFETAGPFQADNGIEGHGGSIDVGGIVVDGDQMFVTSGYSMFGQMPGNVLLAYSLRKGTEQ